MTIDRDLVLRLEKLARLQLSEEARGRITSDLNNILVMVEKLDELDTEGVKPLRHVIEEEHILREDVVNHTITKEEALRNAPDRDDNYFKVPKVIQKQ